MAKNMTKCEKCGHDFPIHLLDAKPETDTRTWLEKIADKTIHRSKGRFWREFDQGVDFTRLECAGCYGPGYVVGDALPDHPC